MRVSIVLLAAGLLLLSGCIQPPAGADNTTTDGTDLPANLTVPPSTSPPPVAPSPTPVLSRMIEALFGWNTYWVNETGVGENRTQQSRFDHCGFGSFQTGPDRVEVDAWDHDDRILDHAVVISHDPQNGLPFRSYGAPFGFGFWQGDGATVRFGSLIADGWFLTATFEGDHVTIDDVNLTEDQEATWRFVYEVDDEGKRYEVTELVRLSYRGTTPAELDVHESGCL